MNENTVKYQVDYIDELYPDGNPWAVGYNDSNNQFVTLISSIFVGKYFKFKYGLFVCPDMYDKFELYNDLHIEDLKKMFAAWTADYNPLDNYSGETERIYTRDDGDETKTHKTGGDGGTHNKVTNQALSGTYTQHDTTTYEDATFRGETKDSQYGGTETIDDVHTEDKTTHSATTKTINSTSYTGDEIQHEIEKKHGNLGVTTSQQMIESEIEMRMKPIEERYLDNFIHEYAAYVGGGWGDLYDY